MPRGSVTSMRIVAAAAAYGSSDAFAGEKINLEFVSANPTGPLHLGDHRPDPRPRPRPPGARPQRRRGARPGAQPSPGTVNRPLEPGDADRFRAGRELDVLIPTRNRPTELAVTLSGLAAQEGAGDFGVVVSDQSDAAASWAHPVPATMVRTLRHRGHPVLLTRHLPRRGLAEHRAWLLAHSAARRVLCLDDDVWLEPGTLRRLLTALDELDCGFVGNAVHGLSYLDDVRPRTHRHYEPWDGPPTPERVRPGTPEWDRSLIHPAANLLHITAGLGLPAGASIRADKADTQPGLGKKGFVFECALKQAAAGGPQL